jgi:hypothetical protein
MENLTDSNLITKSIELDENGVNHISEARKWSMFLSIAAFVALGLVTVILLVILVTVGSRSYSGVYTGITAIITLAFIVIYFFPIYYLYQFSNYSKQAIDGSDSGLLTKAFMYLKMHYRYMGILFIVIMGIYLIIGLVAFLSGGHFLRHF